MRMRLRLMLVACLAVLSASGAASAQAGPAVEAQDRPVSTGPASAAPQIRDLQAIVVTGMQPGPGMWRVSRGDHALWVLGTLSPLPRNIQWDSNAVEKVISQSQEVLASPSVSLKADAGFFGTLALIPSALKARRNPNGVTLAELVPAREYARWQVLKSKYIGRNAGIEQWRPVFAALELYDAAIRKSGMTPSGLVAPLVAKAAKRYGVKITEPKVTITIDRPKAALKEFSASSLDDMGCFSKTLARIEGDLGTMVERANAWAIGDLDRLRELPFGNQFAACSAAFTQAGLARKHGMDDLAQRLEHTWMAAAESALQRNRVTFATLPIAELLKPDGYLAKLAAQGYLVEAP